MQAGFMCMETGLSRQKDSINVALKNAADFGLLTGLGISYLKFKKPDPFYIILGPLAGLVAITAGCNSLTSVYSIFVGCVGAIVAIYINEVLNKYEIDDEVREPEGC